VSAPQLKPYRDPLDLLRRFAPAPIRTQVQLSFATVELETNDLSLFSTVISPGAQAHAVRTTKPSSDDPARGSARSWLWKIVRDADVRGKAAEASIVIAGNLVVFTMGPACLIGADRERKEILGFIGRDIDASVFQEAILPTIVRLTEFVANQQEPSAVLEALGVSGGAACHA
jgi:hypothetical protein